MSTNSEIQWRYSAMKVRLGPFDAMVVMPPLVLFFMHIRIWTLVLAIVVIFMMWVIELFLQMPKSVVWRSIRSFLAGNKRSIVPWWKETKL